MIWEPSAIFRYRLWARFDLRHTGLMDYDYFLRKLGVRSAEPVRKSSSLKEGELWNSLNHTFPNDLLTSDWARKNQKKPSISNLRYKLRSSLNG